MLRRAGHHMRHARWGCVMGQRLCYITTYWLGAGETVRAAYELEYAKDVIEMHVGAVRAGQRVLLVDDLIATGGTMGAGIKLMQQARGAGARPRGPGQPAGAAQVPA